jgi:diguanylate cyclase (GGDEF)-like protein
MTDSADIAGVKQMAASPSASVDAERNGSTGDEFAALALLDAVEDAICVIDESFSLKYMNAALARSFSSDSVPALSGSAIELIVPADRDDVAAAVLSIIDTPGAQTVVRFRLEAIDGQRSLEAVVTNHLHTPGVRGIVGCFRDRSGEVAQQLQNEELKQALDLTADAVMLHDEDGTLLYANPAARRLVRFDNRSMGWPYRDEVTAELQGGILAEVVERGFWLGDVGLRDALGRLRTLSLLITNIERSGKRHVLITGRDETDRRQLERELAVRADTDPLTGLANRSTLGRVLQQRLDLGDSLAVLFVDLDRFKAVNDTLGHEHGDTLLRVVADRMSALVEGDELLGRLGGDEFVVLLGRADVAERTATLAAQILDALSEPVTLGTEVVYMTASVGAAYSDPSERDGDRLLRHADLAMFSAKTSGRNRLVEFTPRLAETAGDRIRLYSALHVALRNEQFEVHYQPIVAHPSGDILSFEALVRWRHPDGSLRGPAEFLKVVEQSDLITEIDTFVLHRACSDLVTWTAGSVEFANVSMSVNVSARQLRRHDLAQVVRTALLQGGLEPHRLVLEVNEDSVMADLDQAIDALRTLRELGVRIAFDDFGTGHCSMAHLRALDAQVLKIDRRFISNASANESDVQVIRALTQLADTFGMATVAEGVETVEQQTLVAEAGCTMMQGYLFDQPLSPSDAAARLRAKS